MPTTRDPVTDAAPAAPAAPSLADLSEDYELLGELGRGGSAVVFRARDRALGRDVAIKVVSPRHGAADDDAVTRLAREARTVAQLQHPNIVTVYAVRRLQGGGLALVMPLVPGRTLKQVVQHEGPLPADRCERVLRDVAQALAYAHARGVVHRDVKPENVFLDEESGRALLADFGIALSDDHDSLTRTGTAIGTPFYMSPEQIDNGQLDGRSDLYSLGLVAWELLTGRRPWDGESLYNVIYKQKHEELPPIEALRSGVPARLQYIVERMLQKQPGARWAGADGLLAQLSHTVLPRDYGRWQAAHKKRVERYRAESRAGRRPGGQPPAPPEAGGLASATMRLIRGVGRPAEPVQSAETLAVDVRPGPRSADASGPTPVRETRPGAARRMRRPSRTRVAEIEPTWATTGSPHRRLIALALLVVAMGGAAATVATLGWTRVSELPAVSRVLAIWPGLRRASDAPTPAASASTTAPLAPESAATTSPSQGGTAVPVGRSLGTIAAGGRHSCVVAAGATIHCWGANERGQLGTGSLVRRTAAARVAGDFAFTQVAAGASHTCAVTRLSDVYCWGANGRGQLGDATMVRRDAPVRIAGSGVYRAVRAGTTHSCALTLDGGVACWGGNDRGQLGDGTRQLRVRPVAVQTPRELSFATLSAGGAHSCALTGAGIAYCWGANESGQLGDGTREDRILPTAVAGDLRFAAIATGPNHTCAVATTGATLCWGRNTFGQSGAPVSAAVLVPHRVRMPSTASQVATGSVHSCALASDGAVYCWGRNSYGQIGNGLLTDRFVPSRARVPEAASEVSATGAHTCAAGVTGRAYCWGYNGEGQLGDTTLVNRPEPTPAQLGRATVVLSASPGGAR